MGLWGRVGGGVCIAFLCSSWAAVARGPLPLIFEPNLGQSDRQVRFLAHGEGFTLFLTQWGIVASGSSGHVSVRLRGARESASIEGLDPLPGKSNYFTGGGAVRGVPHFARARYRDVYPGIDLVFYGDRRRLEFDFEVAPGADPSSVQMEFDGVAPRLKPDGSIEAAPLHLARPVALQGEARVSAFFMLEGAGRVAFRLPPYDRARPLRIDPVLTYSTYLGGDTAASGGNDYLRGVATDTTGNVYVAGATESPSFPTLNAPTPKFRGASWNAFFARIAPDGTVLYSTYFGGDDLLIEAYAIATDTSGSAYVTGYSYIGNFPATPGAYQSQRVSARDVFVLKLDSAGQPVYATLLGGEGDDYGTAIAVDNSGRAVVAGSTASASFPVTPGAPQTSKTGFSVPFVARFSADGSKLEFCTYLGGYGDAINAIALDPSGAIVLAGLATTDQISVTSDALRGRRQNQDGFLLKLDGGDFSVTYATFIGGAANDAVRAMRIDGDGNIWLAGTTYSTDLETSKSAAQPKPGGGGDGFLMKLNPAGKEVSHLSYFGGKGADSVTALAIDGAGFVLAGGETSSPDLPVSSPMQATYGGGVTDAFLAVFDKDVQPVSCTYLGGASEERLTGIALDPSGDPWLAGYTLSADFPVTSGAWRAALSTGGADGFLTRFGSLGTIQLYSTYVGGGGGSRSETASDVVVDSSGAAIIVGTSSSTDFPVTSGSLRTVPAGSTDAFVSRLSSDGTTLLFSTYLGGGAADNAAAVALVPDGSILVAGSTYSSDFPVTDGAAQAKLAGGSDAWISRLSADGSQLLYSTYLGGSGTDSAAALASHAGGDFFVVGSTTSGNFPFTAGSYQTPIAGNDVFAARFSAEGKPVWAARAGGSSSDLPYSAAVDASGRLFIAGSTDSMDFPATSGVLQGASGGGRDGFLLQLNADGALLAFSTYLGGTNSDEIRRIVLEPGGDVIAAGFTNSSNFPATTGTFRTALAGNSEDGFIARVKPDGSTIIWSTFVGANGTDRIYAMAVDSSSNVIVGGVTSSASFPTTSQNAFQTSNRGGYDGFILKLSADGKTLAFSTYLGGSQNEWVYGLALDAAGNPVFVGQTCSPEFPVSPNALLPAIGGPCTGFAGRIDFAGTTQRTPPRVNAILHYVLGTPNVNPGQIVKIAGANLAAASVEAAKPLAKQSSALPVALGGTRVTLASTPVPLFSVSPSEIVAQLPFDAGGGGSLRVSTLDGEASRQVSTTFEAQWGLLAGYRTDGTAVTQQNRLKPGDSVVVLLTGGVLSVAARPANGEPVPASPTYDQFTPRPRALVAAVPPTGDTALDCELVSIRMAPGYVGIAEAVIGIPVGAASSSGVWDLYMVVGEGSSNKLRLYHESR